MGGIGAALWFRYGPLWEWREADGCGPLPCFHRQQAVTARDELRHAGADRFRLFLVCHCDSPGEGQSVGQGGCNKKPANVPVDEPSDF